VIGGTSLRQYTASIVRWWWVLNLSTVVAFAIPYLIGRDQAPQYKATTTLIVGRSLQSPADLQADQFLAQTYADLAQREPILQAVVNKLGLTGDWQDLSRQVEAVPIVDTPLVEITGHSESPARAEAVADETARQLVALQNSSGGESGGQNQREKFVRAQLTQIQRGIANAQKRLTALQASLANSQPADQAALRKEIAALEGEIADRQAAYADLAGLLNTDDQNPAGLSILAPARADVAPEGSHVFLNMVIAGVLGFLFGLVVIAYLERSSDTIKSDRDLQEVLGVPVLGAVRNIRGTRPSQRLITPAKRHLPAADDYRIIRTNIQMVSDSHPVKTILVTNPLGAVGKSTTSANLALIAAQAGVRTVLIDADMRRPRLHELFKIPREPGLSNFLRGNEPVIEDVLHRTEFQNISVVPSGSLPDSPSDLLGSLPMARMLEAMEDVADLVLIDGTPLIPVADAIVLAAQVDCVLLVITLGRTEREATRQSIEALHRASARLLGAVLNRSPSRATYDQRATGKMRETPNGHVRETPAGAKPAQVRREGYLPGDQTSSDAPRFYAASPRLEPN
jgi:capsular exopolysaccharide synthesis family protein